MLQSIGLKIEQRDRVTAVTSKSWENNRNYKGIGEIKALYD